MKGRTPTAEERRYMDAAVKLGCIVCLVHLSTHTPATIHHIDGKTRPGAHLDSIPLCFLHHQGGADCDQYTSRHPYKTRFEARYGSEQSLLAETRRRINWSTDDATP